MNTFHSLVVLKRPMQELWTIMRDHLVEFASQIADIEAVRQVSRTVEPDGVVHVVNEWRARQQVPPKLRVLLNVDHVGWIDRNSWDATSHVCRWTIAPIILAEHISCAGQTEFIPTGAGRGTRVSFTGELHIKPSLRAMLGGIEPTGGLLESIVTTIIPRNLRSVAEAAAAFPLQRDQPMSAP